MSKSRARRFPVQQKTRSNEPVDAGRWFPDVKRINLAIWLVLILSILVVYAQVGHFDFVNYDDTLYVIDNPHVRTGLTLENVKWAWTRAVDYWVPLTLLSHMLACQIFHLDAGMHHLVNALLHTLATLMLFAALRRATNATWPSAWVAFLFAVHPLHVESVAWVTERKDVLSAFFCFLALYWYVRYTERPTVRGYVLVALTFALGLMSKPMLVTFPFVLLLLDFWPLRRASLRRAIWEKVPLLFLSAACACATYLVQKSFGVVESLPLPVRIENALISYAVYLRQMFVPFRLAPIYPYQASPSAWTALASALVLAAVSAIVIFARRTRPYLGVGWFWYLGTLVPVIGLVQAGAQAHADRYMYIPMVGLAMMLAWGAADVIKAWPWTRPAVYTVAIAACLVSMVIARVQAGYWRNSETLFSHAIKVTENNWVAENNLGLYLMNQPGRASEAVPHFKALLAFPPGFASAIDAYNSLGASLLIDRRYSEAIPYLEAALRLQPGLARAHYDLGMALAHSAGRESDAITEYETALRLQPDNDLAHNNLGLLLLRQGRKQEALAHFEAAVRLHPDYGCERNLGDTLATIPGREAEAIAHLEAAQRFNPDPGIAQTISQLRERRK